MATAVENFVAWVQREHPTVLQGYTPKTKAERSIDQLGQIMKAVKFGPKEEHFGVFPVYLDAASDDRQFARAAQELNEKGLNALQAHMAGSDKSLLKDPVKVKVSAPKPVEPVPEAPTDMSFPDVDELIVDPLAELEKDKAREEAMKAKAEAEERRAKRESKKLEKSYEDWGTW